MVLYMLLLLVATSAQIQVRSQICQASEIGTHYALIGVLVIFHQKFSGIDKAARDYTEMLKSYRKSWLLYKIPSVSAVDMWQCGYKWRISDNQRLIWIKLEASRLKKLYKDTYSAAFTCVTTFDWGGSCVIYFRYIWWRGWGWPGRLWVLAVCVWELLLWCRCPRCPHFSLIAFDDYFVSEGLLARRYHLNETENKQSRGEVRYLCPVPYLLCVLHCGSA